MVKQICSFLLLACFCASAYSQDFRFAELRWGSSTSDVRAQLSKQGFSNILIDKDGDVTFDGTLLGYKSRGFALFGSDGLVKVLVSIFVPDKDVRDKYRQLKESLVQKYGKPTDNFEFF